MTPTLAEIRPFQLLPADSRASLEDHIEEVSLERGDALFQAGDASDWVFVNRQGRVHIQHFRADGGVRTMCIVGPGEIFCCLPALDGGPYPATASAAVPSVVYRIPGTLFREVMEANPAFSRMVLQRFCGRLRESGCEGCSGGEDVGSRLATKILAMQRQFGDVIPLSRRELAELAGTTVETAIRITKDFERAGWLKLGRGRVEVLSIEALEQRAQGEREPVEIRLRATAEADAAE